MHSTIKYTGGVLLGKGCPSCRPTAEHASQDASAASLNCMKPVSTKKTIFLKSLGHGLHSLIIIWLLGRF